MFRPISLHQLGFLLGCALKVGKENTQMSLMRDLTIVFDEMKGSI